MNNVNICDVRGVFAGIYAWGDGWSIEIADKWDKYLRNYHGIFWRPIPPKHRMDCWQLVSIGGSIYLHPMDFHAVLYSCGGRVLKGNNDMLEDYFGNSLEELEELCTGLAEACGGKFTSLVAEAHKIENNNLRQLLKGEK